MTSAEFALSLGVRVLNLETYTAVRIDPLAAVSFA
jgi:hypothetical protein